MFRLDTYMNSRHSGYHLLGWPNWLDEGTSFGSFHACPSENQSIKFILKSVKVARESRIWGRLRAAEERELDALRESTPLNLRKGLGFANRVRAITRRYTKERVFRKLKLIELGLIDAE